MEGPPPAIARNGPLLVSPNGGSLDRVSERSPSRRKSGPGGGSSLKVRLPIHDTRYQLEPGNPAIC